MKKPKEVIICDECNKNPALVNSYSVLGRFRKICMECYTNLLEKFNDNSGKPIS